MCVIVCPNTQRADCLEHTRVVVVEVAAGTVSVIIVRLLVEANVCRGLAKLFFPCLSGDDLGVGGGMGELGNIFYSSHTCVCVLWWGREQERRKL